MCNILKPILEFSHSTTQEIVNSLGGYLIVSDEYSACLFEELELVEKCDTQTIERIKIKVPKKIVAVGGCTSLDVGRAVAAVVNAELVCVPTILSTSCISVDRSVVRHPNSIEIKKSVAPRKIIISIPDVMQSPIKWWQSGFGDLFSNISASIDVQYLAGRLSDESIIRNTKKTFEVVEWVLTEFDYYDLNCLMKLATFLHESSLSVIEIGDTRFSAGGEHELYYRMLIRQNYPTDQPTHGQIVSMGTLIAAEIYSKYNDSDLYDKLYSAYERIGLPVNLEGLEAIGITLDHILVGLREISGNTYLGRFANQEIVSAAILRTISK